MEGPAGTLKLPLALDETGLGEIGHLSTICWFV
jgi:hypothetical protein